MTERSLRVWVDLENTPHALFFEPVIRELEKRGHTVAVTARDFHNTVAVVRARGIEAKVIGSGYHGGRGRAGKLLYSGMRALQLWRFARGQGFDVAANHCSRTQTLAARWLHIPVFASIDYEYVDLGVFRSVRRFMIPEVISPEPFVRGGVPAEAMRTYHGLKEDVYLSGFDPPIDMRAELGISPTAFLVVFRPISDTAHYGNDEGYELQERLLARLLKSEGSCVVALPRTAVQRRVFEQKAMAHQNLLVPGTIDGPSLLVAADLVVSGGGTMIREAAVLGVPAISFFEGHIGAVDRSLADTGRIGIARSAAEVDAIPLRRRQGQESCGADPRTLVEVVEGICGTASHT